MGTDVGTHGGMPGSSEADWPLGHWAQDLGWSLGASEARTSATSLRRCAASLSSSFFAAFLTEFCSPLLLPAAQASACSYIFNSNRRDSKSSPPCDPGGVESSAARTSSTPCSRSPTIHQIRCSSIPMSWSSPKRSIQALPLSSLVSRENGVWSSSWEYRWRADLGGQPSGQLPRSAHTLRIKSLAWLAASRRAFALFAFFTAVIAPATSCAIQRINGSWSLRLPFRFDRLPTIRSPKRLSSSEALDCAVPFDEEDSLDFLFISLIRFMSRFSTPRHFGLDH